MNNNLEYKIINQATITGRETYQTVSKFIEENPDVDSIYKIQIDEFLSFLRRQHNIIENESAYDCISDGMKDLLG